MIAPDSSVTQKKKRKYDLLSHASSMSAFTDDGNSSDVCPTASDVCPTASSLDLSRTESDAILAQLKTFQTSQLKDIANHIRSKLHDITERTDQIIWRCDVITQPLFLLGRYVCAFMYMYNCSEKDSLFFVLYMFNIEFKTT